MFAGPLLSRLASLELCWLQQGFKTSFRSFSTRTWRYALLFFRCARAGLSAVGRVRRRSSTKRSSRNEKARTTPNNGRDVIITEQIYSKLVTKQHAIRDNTQDRFEGMGRMLAFTIGGSTACLLLFLLLAPPLVDAWVVGVVPSPSSSSTPTLLCSTRRVLQLQQHPAWRGSSVLGAFSADDDGEMFGESPLAEHEEELTDEQLAETMDAWDDRM